MKYDVFGIGNALVDTEYKVADEFLSSNNVDKGMMTLVEKENQDVLVEALAKNNITEVKRQCGCSASNSIIAVSQFGGSSFYAFKVAADETGRFYLGDIKENGVATKNTGDSLPIGATGQCMVMVTPDAERTMLTHLGITATLDESQIDEEALASSKWLYVEGYLVASPTGQQAALAAVKLAKDKGVKTSLTMSDPNMVKFFKDNMHAIIGEGLDLIFCNEAEALDFTETSDLKAAREKMKSFAKNFVITQGSNGAMIWDGTTFIDIEAYEAHAVDTNGAGDMFAGAFLYAITNGHNMAAAGQLASLASSRVVSQFGPRLNWPQVKDVLKTFSAEI